MCEIDKTRLINIQLVLFDLTACWSGCDGAFIVIIFVTMHEKTRYKLEITSLDNAHLKVQALCYFMLKSDLPK